MAIPAPNISGVYTTGPVIRPSISTPARGPGATLPTIPGENPGGPSIPGTPDFASLITSDPGYIQALAASQAGDANARSALQSQINSALINFGGITDFAATAKAMGMSPDQIAQLTGVINPETGALAAANKNSTLANLSRAHDQAISTLRASLAARGALESGATGVGVGQEDQHYQSGVSAAYSALMQALGGFGSGYANAVNKDAGDLSTAAGNAYNTEANLAMQYPGMFDTTPKAPKLPPVAGDPAPAGYGPVGSTVAPSASPGTYDVGGVQISPGQAAASAVAKATRKPTVKIPNPYSTGQKAFG